MEDLLKQKLQVSCFKKLGESIRSGNLLEVQAYMADEKKVFVKISSFKEADKMFNGEYESLKAIRSTSTIYAPEPLAVVENYKGKSSIALEFMELKSLTRYAASTLGKELARLHLHNIKMEQTSLQNENFVGKTAKDENVISQFGFDIPTACGRIPQINEWTDNWVEFYGMKLDNHVKAIQDKTNDRTVGELWSSLQLKLDHYFKGLNIKPSLLHGDLWAGNVGECQDVAVVFDPSSFYGHHEYDLAIAAMFGGFPPSFWSTYKNFIPRTDGWKDRHELYKLFHQLNHWLHFGSSYKQMSLSTLRNLAK